MPCQPASQKKPYPRCQLIKVHAAFAIRFPFHSFSGSLLLLPLLSSPLCAPSSPFCASSFFFILFLLCLLHRHLPLHSLPFIPSLNTLPHPLFSHHSPSPNHPSNITHSIMSVDAESTQVHIPYHTIPYHTIITSTANHANSVNKKQQQR